MCDDPWHRSPMTWTMSFGGWCRRRDGPARCRGHLANAAEVNVRHAHVERAEHRVRELVVALEAAAEPAAPRREAAAGMQLERRCAAVERRCDVVPGHLQRKFPS